MSLLDLLNSKDPAVSQGLLQAGLSLLQSRGSLAPAIGRAGQAGTIGAQAYRNQTLWQAQEELQNKLRESQLQQIQQQQEQQAKMQALAQQYARSPQQQAMAQNGGPTNAAAAAVPNTAPGFDYQGFAQAIAPMNPMGSLDMLDRIRTKAPQPIKMGEGETLLDPTTYKPLASIPKQVKPADLPNAVQEYQFASGQGYKGTFNDWIKEKARAGASSTSVSVNTGQKGFDNTLKLRGDFRSEPVYKAHQEMQSAYAQIQQSLKQASPAGDLAGATKVMKLLDPGSVVRESELGMAMAASGLLDRAQNYASMVINGTKLTPTQRVDFQKLADALYGESVKQYNAKRGEYEGIAKRNQLPVEDVLGSESKGPAAPSGWSIVKVP